MQKLLRISVVVVATTFSLVTASCSNPSIVRKLNRKNAAQLIERDANRYTEPMTFVSEGKTAVSILQETPSATEFFAAELVEAKELPKTGFLNLVCVSLTNKGKALSKQWEKKAADSAEGNCPHDTFWTVPVADLERLEVTGIRTLSDTSALVDYEVEYKLNKTGRVFKEVGVDNPLPFAQAGSDLEEDTFQYVASLELYDDGWRIIEVERVN